LCCPDMLIPGMVFHDAAVLNMSNIRASVYQIPPLWTISCVR